MTVYQYIKGWLKHFFFILLLYLIRFFLTQPQLYATFKLKSVVCRGHLELYSVPLTIFS